MKVISLITQKGGSGKSTLAECLAVAATLDNKAVAILDMDPQGSAINWKQRRGSSDPAVLPVTMSNLAEEIERVKASGADYVFIDTPARLSDWAMASAKVSDLVIIPSRPTIKDLERVEASIKLSTLDKIRPVLVVLNQVRSRGNRDELAETYIKSKNFPVCPGRIGNRVVFEDADTFGLTPQDIDQQCKAAIEIKHAYKYISNVLEQINNEPMSEKKSEVVNYE